MKSDSSFFVYAMSFHLIMGVMALTTPMLVMGQVKGAANQTGTGAEPLRIAVPVTSFDEFVKVSTDPDTGEINVSGFAVEVFKAVVNTGLPKPLAFNFVPFITTNGSMNGTFDDMLKDVFSQEFDGAVSVSIVYYRTEWVDFTIPYLETGISMLVPLQQRKKNGGIPLTRVTKGFVATTLAYSFIIVIFFWILEHRNGRRVSERQIRPQPSTHDEEWQREIREAIINSRLVMVLLFTLLLVFIACFTASQASSGRASERQSPPRINLNKLIRTQAKVGCQKGSFIKNLLIQQGLLESQLVAYESEQEMLDLLANGGVSAIVELTPKLKLLQGQNCDAFGIVPTFNLHAAGYGFAFQRQSPLIRDFSNGILKLISNGQLGRIQDRTIGSFDLCQDDPGTSNSQILDGDTLWILVAGAIGVLLLTIIMFLLHWGMSSNAMNRKAFAYPCCLLPCC